MLPLFRRIYFLLQVQAQLVLSMEALVSFHTSIIITNRHGVNISGVMNLQELIRFSFKRVYCLRRLSRFY
jgi:hypothetical protein